MCTIDMCIVYQFVRSCHFQFGSLKSLDIILYIYRDIDIYYTNGGFLWEMPSCHPGFNTRPPDIARPSSPGRNDVLVAEVAGCGGERKCWRKIPELRLEMMVGTFFT